MITTLIHWIVGIQIQTKTKNNNDLILIHKILLLNILLAHIHKSDIIHID